MLVPGATAGIFMVYYQEFQQLLLRGSEKPVFAVFLTEINDLIEFTVRKLRVCFTY